MQNRKNEKIATLSWEPAAITNVEQTATQKQNTVCKKSVQRNNTKIGQQNKQKVSIGFYSFK